MKIDSCILCGNKLTTSGLDTSSTVLECDCPNCGVYRTSLNFLNSTGIFIDDYKHLLSGYVREMKDVNTSIVTITLENYKDILSSSIIPKTVYQKLMKLLFYLYKNTKGYGDIVLVDFMREPSILYARHVTEASRIVKFAIDREYIENMVNGYILTYMGMQEAEKNIISIKAQTNKCFVAMWFDDAMEHIYQSSIKTAVEDKASGNFEAVRIDSREFNDDITDAIIAEIKECRFVIADLSGYRGGVYYEAGYAKGMGKPVIFTCRKDWFEGEIDSHGHPIKERVHFDINHMNIIVWETPEDLKRKLINRIRSTIL